MSPIKIGSSQFRPTSEITGGKKPAAAKEAAVEAPRQGEYDTASVNPNRLAVMPRMSTAGSGSAQSLKGSTVESLLRDSARELDDYFSSAYGFKE